MFTFAFGDDTDLMLLGVSQAFPSRSIPHLPKLDSIDPLPPVKPKAPSSEKAATQTTGAKPDTKVKEVKAEHIPTPKPRRVSRVKLRGRFDRYKVTRSFSLMGRLEWRDVQVILARRSTAVEVAVGVLAAV